MAEPSRSDIRKNRKLYQTQGAAACRAVLIVPAGEKGGVHLDDESNHAPGKNGAVRND